LNKFRDWIETKARGKWLSENTLRRYAKPGTVQRYLSQCNIECVQFGEMIWGDHKLLSDMVAGKKTVTPPECAKAAAPTMGTLLLKKPAVPPTLLNRAMAQRQPVVGLQKMNADAPPATTALVSLSTALPPGILKRPAAAPKTPSLPIMKRRLHGKGAPPAGRT